MARSRGAVLDSNDLMFALSHLGRLGEDGERARFQIAHRDQTVISLDPTLRTAVCTLENQGGPTLEVLGVASVGRQRFTPQPRKNVRYQVLDTLSYVHRGASTQRRASTSTTSTTSEQTCRCISAAGISSAAFPPRWRRCSGCRRSRYPGDRRVQLGIPGRYVQGYGNSRPYTYSDFSLFAQDDWRITPRLTAKLGVRYQVQCWPDITYKVSGYPTPYTFPGDGNNIAPRLGLVWDPLGDRRTTVHGAYGLYFDNLITGIAGITKAINGTRHACGRSWRRCRPR